MTTDPSPLPYGHSITLSIDNGGDAEAGTATVSDPANGILTQSATIKVLGGTQTTVGHSKKLTIVAKLDGAGPVIARSGGFSVCAHIVNFHLNGKQADWITVLYGMVVKMNWDSDDAANTRAMLDHCFWMEKVTPTENDNPPWTPGALNVQTTPVAGNAPGGVDDHSIPRNWLQGSPPTKAGHNKLDQEYDFYCARCGMTQAGLVKIPDADFKIDHNCEANAAGEYHVITVKTGPGGPVSSSKQKQWAPIAPINVAGTVNIDPANPNAYTITITWTDRSEIESAYIASWEVQGFQEIESPEQAADSQTYTSPAYNITNQRGKPVVLRVKARNAFGDSPVATATITFPN